MEPEQHRLLMHWAILCAEHVLPLLGKPDMRLEKALAVAKAWERSEVQMLDAREAAYGVLETVREITHPVDIAVARATCHAVSTAHMSDHSLGSAWYARKAVKAAGGRVEDERNWQLQNIPDDIRELVLSTKEIKKFSWL